jgi:type III secretion control protein HpaP
MQTSTHRAHIIASPVAHAHDTGAAASPQLRRQAALFRLHREAAAADTHDVPPAPHRPSGPPAEPDAPADRQHDLHLPPGFAETVEPDEHRHDGNDDAGDGDTPDDASGDASGDAGSEPANASVNGPTHASSDSSAYLAVRSTDVPAEAHTPQPAAHAASTRAVPIRNISPALDDVATPHRFIDFIVSRVADFSSNPAVLARGHWHITIALDPALLSGCELSLMLSHFALTLRFDLSSEHSRYLILKHEPSLRERLDALMQSRSDGPCSIDIIVT